jgi:hypothetical protein
MLSWRSLLSKEKSPYRSFAPTRAVEIPAIAEMVEGTLSRMQKFSQQNELNIEVNLLKPPPEQSFWVNMIGRGYPPPNRTFRWCTQRLKIDPVNVFVNQRLGHWGEAILHLGARREESASRAQTMAGRARRNGLNRHPDLPRVWVSNPIEFLTTEEVWAYLLQNLIHGAATTGRFTSSTPTPPTANAPFRLTPAPRPAGIPASAAGPAPSSTATKPAKGCSPPAMSAWNISSSSAKRFWNSATPKTAGATAAA